MRRPDADQTVTGAWPRLVVPAYFHPAVHPGQWEWLALHAAEIRLVILNIASGPGSKPEPVFQAAAARLHEAGVRVAGYVDTDYGRRPADQVLAEVRCYLDWYGAGGVCYDRAAGSAEHLGHYAALADGARTLGVDYVFFNHGVYPLEPYARHADLLGTFEGPWPAYRHLAVPRWVAAQDASKFYHVVYAVPPQRREDALLLAVRRRAASVYLTDRSGLNPYDELPAEALRRTGPGRAPGLRPGSSDPGPAGRAGAAGHEDPPVPSSGHRAAKGPARPWRVPMVIAALILVLAAVAWTTRLLPGTGGGGQTCQRSFVPAFFSLGNGWTQAVRSRPPPTVMILDLTDTGAGTSPEPGFQAAVRGAQAAGIRVIGYVATEYGQRPIAQAEADARNYKAWYGVSGIFLDQAPASRAQLGYYRNLADYIRGISRGAVVWLNPGIYPDQAYMSVADVVMTFEGPYARYRDSRVPGWVSQYPPGRFANTIYATSSAEFENALHQSAGANAGNVFITDRSGTNPYSGLPAYWAHESASVAASCTGHQ